MEEEGVVFDCPICGFAVETQEVARYNGSSEVEFAPVVIDPSDVTTIDDLFVLRSCPKCKSPFLHRYKYYNHWEVGSFLRDTEQLYPIDKEAVISLGTIPTKVKGAFEKAKKCHSTRMYEPAVIMARKCLEAVCGDLGASGRNLADRIDWLLKNEKIDKKLHNWATQLRLVGNDAAHDLEMTISRKDSEDSLSFLNAMLLYIFTLDRKFNEFVKRREKANDNNGHK